MDKEMKKGQVYEGIIERVDFPNKGIIAAEDGKYVTVKNGICGQRVSFSVNKVRKGKCEGRILEVLERSPLELEQPPCAHFGSCGGCTYLSLPYEEQLHQKEEQVKRLQRALFSNCESGSRRLPVSVSAMILLPLTASWIRLKMADWSDIASL